MKAEDLIRLFANTMYCDKSEVTVEDITECLYELKDRKIPLTINNISIWLKKNYTVNERKENE